MKRSIALLASAAFAWWFLLLAPHAVPGARKDLHFAKEFGPFASKFDCNADAVDFQSIYPNMSIEGCWSSAGGPYWFQIATSRSPANHWLPHRAPLKATEVSNFDSWSGCEAVLSDVLATLPGEYKNATAAGCFGGD